MWTRAWETQFSSTSSNTWRDFCWKNLIHFYKPKQVQCCLSQMLERLWGDHGRPWTRILVLPTYSDLLAGGGKNNIEKTRGFNISYSFTLLYLRRVPNELNSDDTCLLKILLTSAKKAITKYWLRKEPPQLICSSQL